MCHESLSCPNPECGEAIRTCLTPGEEVIRCPRCGTVLRVLDPTYGQGELYRLEPHRGVTILVMGLLSLWFFCLPLGPIAWVMANTDLREIEAGRMDPNGRNLAVGGRILGIIATVLVGLLVLIFGVVLFIVLSAGSPL